MAGHFRIIRKIEGASEQHDECQDGRFWADLYTGISATSGIVPRTRPGYVPLHLTSQDG